MTIFPSSTAHSVSNWKLLWIISVRDLSRAFGNLVITTVNPPTFMATVCSEFYCRVLPSSKPFPAIFCHFSLVTKYDYSHDCVFRKDRNAITFARNVFTIWSLSQTLLAGVLQFAVPICRRPRLTLKIYRHLSLFRLTHPKMSWGRPCTWSIQQTCCLVDSGVVGTVVGCRSFRFYYYFVVVFCLHLFPVTFTVEFASVDDYVSVFCSVCCLPAL